MFRGFFDFDDDATPEPNLVTASIIERKLNSKTIKSYMQSASLGYAYQNAASIAFKNTDDVSATADILESQFQKVSQDLSGDQLEALSDLRSSVQSLFDEIKLSTNQVLTVRTAAMPARVLAFGYYGGDSLGVDIIELNDDGNVSFYEGDIKVLSV